MDLRNNKMYQKDSILKNIQPIKTLMFSATTFQVSLYAEESVPLRPGRPLKLHLVHECRWLPCVFNPAERGLRKPNDTHFYSGR